MSFLFFLCFYTVFAENIKPGTFEQDSLRSIQLNKEGVKAGRLGDFEGSIISFQKVIELQKRIYGESSTKLATPLINLGIQYKNLGEYDKAIENYSLAERLLIAKYSTDYPRLGFVYLNLGIIYKLKGDYVNYREFQENALRVSYNFV